MQARVSSFQTREFTTREFTPQELDFLDQVKEINVVRAAYRLNLIAASIYMEAVLTAFVFNIRACYAGASYSPVAVLCAIPLGIMILAGLYFFGRGEDGKGNLTGGWGELLSFLFPH